jgi:hypothetical protein
MGVSRIAFVLLCVPFSLPGQNRYFVSFKDKTNTPYSVSSPQQFLSQKSIDRRTKEKFTTNESDLPVDPGYVQGVKAGGASVFFKSRWFNGVLIQCSSSVASVVSSLPFVANVELVAPGAQLIGGRKSTINKFKQSGATTTLQNQTQLQMIGLDQMQAAGYHGDGMDVAVFDAGFIGVNTLPAFQAIFQQGRLMDAFNFVNNSNDVYSAFYHGTEVLSIMAASVANTYQGGVDQANYFLYQTEDAFSEYRVEEYNWLFAAERADSAGVDVINSSLGYNTFDDPTMDYTYSDLDGKTSVVSRAASMAADRGIVVVNSAGNEGDNSWQYIDVPADARGVLACGAVNYSGVRSPFSSTGPTSDGRIKPDVCALGEGDVVISTTGTITTGSGTSYSSPLIACLAAGLRQALPQASAKEIYKRIITSASQATQPDTLLGYGIPNFLLAKDVTNFEDEFQLYPNPVSNGQLSVIFKNPNDQLFITTIFNVSGQKVFELTDSIDWGNNPYVFDLSMLSDGLYLVRVETQTSSRTVRVAVTGGR